MAGLNGTITFEHQRRRATVTLNPYWKKKLKLENDTVDCRVLGLMQYKNAEEAEPVFVCELNDGRVFEISPCNAVFTDTDHKTGVIL